MLSIINPGQIYRLMRINFVLAWHGLDDIIFATRLFRPFRVVIFLLPWNWFRRNRAPRGVRIRKALEDLGPVFIKFGQVISTRRDLLPDDIVDELEKLQDAVPAFSGKVAQQIIEKALGKPVEAMFDDFETEALASASVAQVHTAKLKDGKEVVVKVLRPDILPVIRRDIGLLYTIARLACRYSSIARRLRAVEVVAEFDKTINDELDLMREAANATQLRRNFEGATELYVPEIYWDYTRINVLTMERVYGISIRDMEALKKANTNLKKLAENGVEIFFTQVFTHNFFHADMHPGNVFVNVEDPEDPKYVAVDFGIIGTLSSSDKRYLAENFLAFFQRDYHKVAVLHVESGWVPRGTRIDEFESAIRSVCEPIFERPLKEISFGQLLLRLFQTAQRFNMEIQPQLVLLQKTLLNIEGLGRQLYPDLDLWKTAKPFLEKTLGEQVGLSSMLHGFKENLPFIIEKLPELPAMIINAIEKASKGDQAGQQLKEIQQLKEEIHAGNKRTVLAIAGSTLILSAFIVFGLGGIASATFWGAPVVSWGAGVAGVVLLWSAIQD